jgi:hypothetical protein
MKRLLAVISLSTVMLSCSSAFEIGATRRQQVFSPSIMRCSAIDQSVMLPGWLPSIMPKSCRPWWMDAPAPVIGTSPDEQMYLNGRYQKPHKLQI